MGILVKWDNDSHLIICNIFDREWTWDDFHSAKAQSYEMIRWENHPVAIVFVVPSDVLVPSNFVSHITTLLRQMNERRSALVMVGGNPYIRALVKVLESVAGRSGGQLRTFDTLDQARKWVAAWEQSLSESSANA
jgi:hypothetical protein